MKSFLILILIAVSSVASATADFEQLLNLPIDQRAAQFLALKEQGRVYLSKAAFDHEKSLQTRWRALTTMGRIDPSAFSKDLDKALTSGEWFMRNAALIALQSDDRARAVNWSVRLLNDSALVVRTQAVRNLIQLDAREVEGQLWEQMFSGKNFRGREGLWVRVHLAEALAKFTSKGREKSFERLLMDTDERLHKWAILGLENTTGIKIGDKSMPQAVLRQQWLERLGIQEI